MRIRTLHNSLTAQVRVRATPQLPVASIPLPVRYHWCAARPHPWDLPPRSEITGVSHHARHIGHYTKNHRKETPKNSYWNPGPQQELHYTTSRYRLLLPQNSTFTRLGVASDSADTIIPQRMYRKVRFRIGTPKSVEYLLVAGLQQPATVTG